MIASWFVGTALHDDNASGLTCDLVAIGCLGKSQTVGFFVSLGFFGFFLFSPSFSRRTDLANSSSIASFRRRFSCTLCSYSDKLLSLHTARRSQRQLSLNHPPPTTPPQPHRNPTTTPNPTAPPPQTHHTTEPHRNEHDPVSQHPSSCLHVLSALHTSNRTSQTRTETTMVGWCRDGPRDGWWEGFRWDHSPHPGGTRHLSDVGELTDYMAWLANEGSLTLKKEGWQRLRADNIFHAPPP